MKKVRVFTHHCKISRIFHEKKGVVPTFILLFRKKLTYNHNMMENGLKYYWAEKDPCWVMLGCSKYVYPHCEAYLHPELPCWKHTATQCEKLVGAPRVCRECRVYKHYNSF